MCFYQGRFRKKGSGSVSSSFSTVVMQCKPGNQVKMANGEMFVLMVIINGHPLE